MSNADNTYLQTDLQQYTNTHLLPQVIEPPIQSAMYKSTATDFVVIEQMEIDFSEEGEHLWLQVEKTGVNTTHLSKELAKWANIPIRDVGYSGIKDRHAVTTQWFSLRIPKKKMPPLAFIYPSNPNDSDKESQEEKVIVLQQHWHNKKLNRGTHKANRFIITLRDIVLCDIAGSQEAVNAQLEVIQKQGVPNYFGEQRFGRNGNNLAQVLAWFDQVEKERALSLEMDLKENNQVDNNGDNISGQGLERKQKKKSGKHDKRQERKNRDTESILLSAARSVIFNQILAQRVIDNTWQTGLEGEVFNLAGTGSVFFSEKLDNELINRLKVMDIHPTAVLWGNVSEKTTQPNATAKALESSIVENSLVLTKLAMGLEKMGLKSARRSLRLQVNDLTWEWQTKDVLQLTFELPKGSFATSVLASLIH